MGVGMTPDQIKDFEGKIEGIIEKYYHDPYLFVIDVLKATPTTQQTAVLKDVAIHRKISIKAGHGVGKSTVISWIILWYLMTRGFPRIVCTAPTANQLHDILWAELAKWMRNSPILTDWFTWTKTQIYFKGAPEDWFAVARTATKSEALAGRHAGNFMLVVDEASGVDDDIYETSEGMLTGPNVYVIMISNPTRSVGYFHDTFADPNVAKDWSLHSLSCLGSLIDEGGLVTQKYIDGIKTRYGEDSNVYRVRVLGEFPIGDEDTLIPRSWVDEAVNREVHVDKQLEPLIMGVDVGAGGDLSIILFRQGAQVLDIHVYNFVNTMDLVSEVAKKYKERKAHMICIDPIGIGKGAYDTLVRNTGINVIDVDVRRSSYMPEYAKLRDEIYWRVRDQFERGNISIPYDKDLITELSSIKYDAQNRNKIQSKADMKRPVSRGGIGHSPDRADALALTFYMEDEVLQFGQYDNDDLFGVSNYTPTLERKRNAMTGY